jgi:hypothetical protein
MAEKEKRTRTKVNLRIETFYLQKLRARFDLQVQQGLTSGSFNQWLSRVLETNAKCGWSVTDGK